MHVQLPHNITDLSLTFFAKGRPYEVQKSHAHFGTIRTTLLDWNNAERGIVDIDALIKLADPTVELRAASGERLTFAGREMRYDGLPLHNLWVDKIIAFKDEGENFDPIFRALEDLQLNPTPAARERLPLFVERSKLGFLPDGRIAAFKGVRDNYNDVHSNTVNYAVGKTVSMPRHECNANPDQTCTTGLHLGAIDYIRNNGYGWGSDRRMLLCAFWPRHVVAVPVDYHGGKMRVEELTVLDEVDRKYVNELLNSSTTLVRGYDTPATTAAPAPVAEAKPEVDVREPYQKAKVGDWIEVEDDQYLSDGEYLVVAVDDASADNQRLSVKTGSSDDDTEWVDDDAVTGILPSAPDWFLAKLGDWIEYDEYGDTRTGEVIEIDESSLNPGDGSRLRVHDGSEETWVDNDDVEQILASPPPVYLRARMDDLITIADNPVLRDGEFKVVEIFDDSDSDKEDGSRLGVEINNEPFPIINRSIRSIKREVEAAVAKGEAAAAASTAVVVAGASAPVVANLWEQVLKGDKVRVAGDPDIQDGEYIVDLTDSGLTHGPDGVGIMVSGLYIYNKNLKEILERDGKPFVLPGVMAPAVAEKQPWDLAEVGDTVRVEGSRWVQDGDYVVDRVQSAEQKAGRGPDFGGSSTEYGVHIAKGGWFIEKRAVKAIVRKKGEVEVPADGFVPVDTSKKLHEQASTGDFARVTDGSYSSAGEYEIVAVNEDSRAMTFKLKAPFKTNKSDLWVYDRNVTHIRKANAVTAPAAEEVPLYKQVAVGDRIKVEGSHDTPDGEYEVTRTDDYRSGYRVSVDNQGKNGRVWWVGHGTVKAIVRKGPATVSTEPAWKLAKVGDTVEVKGAPTHRDGSYVVDRVDEGNGGGKRLKLVNPGGTRWVNNEYVVSIVSTAGYAPVRDPAAFAKAKIGDTVTVKGSSWVKDGDWRVIMIDEGDNERLRVRTDEDERWVRNEHVFALKEVVQGLTWRDAEVGDSIRVEGHSTVADGDYEVIATDKGDVHVPLKLMIGSERRWVRSENLKAVTKKAA
ncbi:hypothetical protein DA075_06630 [Methylobacterium currus]|uniref:Uncharacterized protein n=1 Tax=Methylobacterium currus TaxID=2051553 RepID=A0A2R4WGI2_9HYPH|nr:hypothetical protein [Methylobacterium currus]AWB20639.1 hypothetical protein DA075_06630 [Methylobacterium currus]